MQGAVRFRHCPLFVRVIVRHSAIFLATPVKLLMQEDSSVLYGIAHADSIEIEQLLSVACVEMASSASLETKRNKLSLSSI